MDYLQIANSPVMFIVCGIVIIYVVLQSLFFMRRAWKHGIELGMDPAVMKSTIRQSALFSIVPSIPILIILVMLMAALGKYFPWLRLSVIGSSSYEYTAATIAARAFGLESFTDSGYTTAIFIATLWAMSICILYEPLLVIFGKKPLDKAMGKLRVSKPSLYALLIDGVFIALLSWFCAPYMISWVVDKSQICGLAAVIVAMISAQILNVLGKKTGKSIYTEFSFPGGMIFGMIAAYVANLFL